MVFGQSRDWEEEGADENHHVEAFVPEGRGWVGSAAELGVGLRVRVGDEGKGWRLG